MANDRIPRRESPTGQLAPIPCPLFLLRRTELLLLEGISALLCIRGILTPRVELRLGCMDSGCWFDHLPSVVISNCRGLGIQALSVDVAKALAD
jgi:hypothetical protein